MSGDLTVSTSERDSGSEISLSYLCELLFSISEGKLPV